MLVLLLLLARRCRNRKCKRRSLSGCVCFSLWWFFDRRYERKCRLVVVLVRNMLLPKMRIGGRDVVFEGGGEDRFVGVDEGDANDLQQWFMVERKGRPGDVKLRRK